MPRTPTRRRSARARRSWNLLERLESRRLLSLTSSTMTLQVQTDRPDIGQPIRTDAVDGLHGLAIGPDGSLPISGPYERAVRSIAATADVTVTRLPTTTELRVPGSSYRLGQAYTIQAIVSAGSGPVVQGTVTFRDGGAEIATVPVSGGVASLRVVAGTLGVRRYSATYNGSASFEPSQPGVTTASPIRLVGGKGVAGLQSTLGVPTDLAFDRAGNLYVSDPGTATVRRVNADGSTTIIAGGEDRHGYLGDGGPATEAQLSSPLGLAFDAAGNLLIADRGNRNVRKVTPDGIISTVVGFDPRDDGDNGDGGPAFNATLGAPFGLAFDAAGNLYISDFNDARVRRVTPDGIISTFVGIGRRLESSGDGGPATLAGFVFTGGITFDAAGNLYVTDPGIGRVRRVTPDGIISTVAGGGSTPGGDGGPADLVSLNSPSRVAVDLAGNLYIAENGLIRKVSSGIITTLAGDGTFGTSPDGTAAGSTRLGGSLGLAFDAAGNLFYADTGYGAVRTFEATTDVKVTRRAASFRVTGFPSEVIAGVPQLLTVTALDEDGNVLDDDNGEISLSNSDPRADPAPPILLRNGVGTFSIRFRTPGRQTLTVVDADEPVAAMVDIVPGVAVRYELAIATGPILGSRPVTVLVTAYDSFGNLATRGSAFLRASSSDPRFTSVLGISLSQGTASVPVRFGTAGLQSLTIRDSTGGRVSGTLDNLNVEAITTGRVYLDRDNSPDFPAGDPGLPGRVVYLDSNNNGRYDAGEPTATSGADGSFTIAGIANRREAPIRDRAELASSFRNAVDRFTDVGDGTALVGVVPVASIDPVPVVPIPFNAVVGYRDASRFVHDLYRTVLGRDGSRGEIDAWVGGLEQGQTREAVVAQFVNSPEHRRRQVDSYYRTYLGRDADEFSQVWVDQLQAGVSEAEVAASILASDEFQAGHRDDATYVSSLYREVLGRDADPDGLAYATRELARGVRRIDVARGLVGSDEAIDQVIESFYAGYLRRSRDPLASDWADVLRQPTGSASEVAIGILSSREFIRRSEDISGSVPLQDFA